MDLSSIGDDHLDLEITERQYWLDSGKQPVTATNEILIGEYAKILFLQHEKLDFPLKKSWLLSGISPQRRARC